MILRVIDGKTGTDRLLRASIVFCCVIWGAAIAARF